VGRKVNVRLPDVKLPSRVCTWEDGGTYTRVRAGKESRFDICHRVKLVWGLGSGFRGLRFGVYGVGVKGLGFTVYGLRFGR